MWKRVRKERKKKREREKEKKRRAQPPLPVLVIRPGIRSLCLGAVRGEELAWFLPGGVLGDDDELESRLGLILFLDGRV